MNSKDLSNIGIVFFSALIILGLFAHFNIAKGISRSLEAGGQYQLNISVKGAGSVKREPNGPYQEGQKVELYARPDVGWAFDHWVGDVADPYSKVTTIIMDSDKSVTAVFKGSPEEYYLTINKEGNGNGAVEVEEHQPIKLMGQRYGPYPEGTAITLSALPADDGSSFAGWKGDISSTKRQVEFIIKSDMQVTAVFTKPQEVKLIYSTEPKTAGEIDTELLGGGIVETEAVEIYPYSSDVQLTTKATNEGYVFDHWTKNGSTYSGSPQVTVTLKQDTTMKAYFSTHPPNEVTLNVDIIGRGTVNRVEPKALDADKQFTVNKRETISLRAMPDEGYEFVGWGGARETKSSTVSVLMDSDKNITAHFQEKKPVTEKPPLIATIIGTIGFIGSVSIRFL